MDAWQMIFGSALALACIAGRRDRLIVGVMLANFAATVAFAEQPLTVGFADILCMTLLLTGSARARVVAAFFAAMSAIYPIGVWFGLTPATIYTIVDALAFLQLVVVGRGDHGIASGRRYIGRLRRRIHLSLVRRADAGHDAGLAAQPDGGR
ncbi:MAG: hypothetical protein ACRCSU_04930 [Paracoccaceae bacterium]